MDDLQPKRYCSLVWKFGSQSELEAILVKIAEIEGCEYRLTFRAAGRKSKNDPFGRFGEIGFTVEDKDSGGA